MGFVTQQVREGEPSGRHVLREEAREGEDRGGEQG